MGLHAELGFVDFTLDARRSMASVIEGRTVGLHA